MLVVISSSGPYCLIFQDTVVQMTDQEDDPSDIEKTKQSLPNDAVFQDGFPPLILPGLAVRSLYVLLRIIKTRYV